jgi:hypothetical protein
LRTDTRQNAAKAYVLRAKRSVYSASLIVNRQGLPLEGVSKPTASSVAKDVETTYATDAGKEPLGAEELKG